MRMPGFTADESVERIGGRYSLSGSFTQEVQVLQPAQFCVGECWNCASDACGIACQQRYTGTTIWDVYLRMWCTSQCKDRYWATHSCYVIT